MDTPAAPTPTSHYFMSLRTRLHYLDWGNSAAPLLVLVHGGFDHGRSWDWTARALSSHYHVIVPDLRGHGDSGWSSDGGYAIHHHIYDLAQLIAIQNRDPVTIIGHSLGGSIALRYAGLFPEKVAKLVAIEGLGMTPTIVQTQQAKPATERWMDWIDDRRIGATRTPRRYPTIEAAIDRMRERNQDLSLEQALHLTIHGTNRNEDGTYSWKFDPYLRPISPFGTLDEQLPEFWGRISCPVLLCLGLDSWASNPMKDGRAAHFADVRLAEFADAGHWLHHDQFDTFIAELRAFL
jgi:pimeloyl-ACP methyl ester carboxylesterase